MRLGWRTPDVTLECLAMSSLLFPLLPLMLLLLVTADGSLGNQHFLAEPADKVATRGERVSLIVH